MKMKSLGSVAQISVNTKHAKEFEKRLKRANVRWKRLFPDWYGLTGYTITKWDNKKRAFNIRDNIYDHERKYNRKFAKKKK